MSQTTRKDNDSGMMVSEFESQPTDGKKDMSSGAEWEHSSDSDSDRVKTKQKRLKYLLLATLIACPLDTGLSLLLMAVFAMLPMLARAVVVVGRLWAISHGNRTPLALGDAIRGPMGKDLAPY